MAAEVGIVALPVGLLMIAGELDISVGAVLPASSLTVAIVSGHYGLPIYVGIAGGLCVGLAVGFLNGLLVTRTRIPSLIITIGTMFGVMGLTLGFTILIAGSTGVFIVPDPLTKSLFGAALGGMFQVGIFWWAGVRRRHLLSAARQPLGQLDLRARRRPRERAQRGHSHRKE